MVNQIVALKSVRRSVAENLTIALQRPVRVADVAETQTYQATLPGTADWAGQETVCQARAWLLCDYRRLYRMPG